MIHLAGTPGQPEPSLLVKISPQHGPRSGGHAGATRTHIGILHAGFTNISAELLQGDYAFESAVENGMLDMSLYSAMHGYTYLRVAFEPPNDRMWGYGKAIAIKHALQLVDILVVVDFDVAFMDLSTPLEDLLLRWGFKSEQLVLAAEDPQTPMNTWTAMEDGEEKTHLNLNIGFLILRNHPKVIKSLDTFAKCVDDVPECEAYRSGGSFPDQTAWNKFVLPIFTADEVIRAPCDEANGYRADWGENFGCQGTFVHHAWLEKYRLFEFVRDRLMHEAFKHTFSYMFSFQAAEFIHY